MIYRNLNFHVLCRIPLFLIEWIYGDDQKIIFGLKCEFILRFNEYILINLPKNALFFFFFFGFWVCHNTIIELLIVLLHNISGFIMVYVVFPILQKIQNFKTAWWTKKLLTKISFRPNRNLHHFGRTLSISEWSLSISEIFHSINYSMEI